MALDPEMAEINRSTLFACRKFIPLSRNGTCKCSVARLLPFFHYDVRANWSELANVVARGDTVALEHLMRQTINLRLSDRCGNTPIHLSIIFKKMDVLQHLLSMHGLNIDAPNLYGQTPLHLAVIDEEEDMILALLNRGADVNFPDDACCTPLHVASTRQTPRMCQLLLDRGADMHSQNILGKNAVYHACQYGTMETACMLLYNGANAAATDRFGIYPLTVAMDRSADSHDFHEILFNYTFERQKISVNLTTMTTAMKIRSPLFLELLKKVDDVKFGRNDLIELSKNAVVISEDYFKLFMRKHPYVTREMLQFSNHLYHHLTVATDPCDALVLKLLDLLSTLFQFRRGYNFLKGARCFDGFIPTVATLYRQQKITMDTLSKAVFFLYSFGLTCELDHLIAIYEACGHCALFKQLLHMEICFAWTEPKSLMLYLICNVRMTINKLLKYVTRPCPEHVPVMRFFASRKLHNFFAADEEIYERVRELPEVPSLVELARNSARKYIIKKFKVRKTRDFYDVMKKLPISEVYKKILTYEKELYIF